MPGNILESEEFGLLRHHGHMQEYVRGDYIVNEGDSGSSICLVVSGSAAVLNEDEEGRELCVNILGPGTFFGEMGLYRTDWQRTASVRARCKCQVLELDYRNFLGLAAEHNRLLIRIIHQLSLKLDEMTRRARQFVHMGASERVLYVLRELARHSDAEPCNGGVLLAVTKHEIANFAGCTRETVSRALQELEEGGVIENQGRKVLVLHQAE